MIFAPVGFEIYCKICYNVHIKAMSAGTLATLRHQERNIMPNINDVEMVRRQIRHRYETNPQMRINVSLTHPKLQLQNVQVTITGVFSHLFQIEECDSGRPLRHALQYSDVLLHHIEILD